MSVPLPDNEAARLKTLCRYAILDTAPEAAFDDLVRLAARLCDVPIAFVGLMDADRQWFKAQIGLDPEALPRDETFCAHTLLQRGPLLIPDTRKDARFACLPLAASRSGIRFYAGVPLIAPDTHAIGTLGVMDRNPRTLNAAQIDSLEALARQAMALLELRCRTTRHPRACRPKMSLERPLPACDTWVRDFLESLTDGFIALDRHWRYTYINSNAARLSDLPAEAFLGKVIWKVFPEAVGTPYYEALQRAMRTQKPVHFEDYHNRRGGWFEYHAYPTKEGLAIYTRDVTERKSMVAALRESEERYRTLVRNFPNGSVFLFDPNLRYEIADGTGLATVGPSREAMEGRTIWEVFPEAMCREIEPAYQAALAGKAGVLEVPYAGRVYMLHVHPVKNERGDVVAGMAMTQDITERKRAEEALRDSEERFASVIRSMKEGLILVDSEGIIRLCNRSAEQILDLSARQMIGRKARTLPWRMIHEETAEFSGEAPAVLLSLCTGIPLPDVTMGIPSTDAKMRWLSVNTAPLFHAGERQPYAALATFTDITERKQDEQGLKQIMNQMDDYRMKLQRQKMELETVNARLAALANSDGLTGLKNRRAFRETLRHEFDYALRYRTPLSLILADVDQFKEYNDAFGHPAGDEVLVRVAWILQANARSTDLVARYGGEEFVILMPNTDRFGAISLAERFRLAIETAAWKDRLVTASFGISSLTLTTSDPALLIGEADAALYASKKGGRNRTTHYDQLTSANPSAA